MYNLKRNNYHLKPKPSNIQTPLEVSQFIFELLKDKFSRNSLILDPCSGMGNLLKPWEVNNYLIYGVDIEEEKSESDLIADFFTLTKKEFELNYFAEFEVKKPILILCNPPFNGYGKKLGSERSLSTFDKVGKVWLDKIIELFGSETPIVLFVPIGFRLNLTKNSSRWKKLSDSDYPIITSIISLPKNIFEGVVFHSERIFAKYSCELSHNSLILIFNLKGLKGHYFLPKSTPNEIPL